MILSTTTSRDRQRIEEGRAVYANIRKFTTNLPSNTRKPALHPADPLQRAARLPVVQILAVDWARISCPAGAGVEPPEPGLMDHPPRSAPNGSSMSAAAARAARLGSLQDAAVLRRLLLALLSYGYRTCCTCPARPAP